MGVKLINSLKFAKVSLSEPVGFECFLFRNCREMQPVCGGGGIQKIMYAWAKNAPSLRMPKGKIFSHVKPVST